MADPPSEVIHTGTNTPPFRPDVFDGLPLEMICTSKYEIVCVHDRKYSKSVLKKVHRGYRQRNTIGCPTIVYSLLIISLNIVINMLWLLQVTQAWTAWYSEGSFNSTQVAGYLQRHEHLVFATVKVQMYNNASLFYLLHYIDLV